MSVTLRTEGTVQLSPKTNEKVEQEIHVPLNRQIYALNLDNEQLPGSLIPLFIMGFCSFPSFQRLTGCCLEFLGLWIEAATRLIPTTVLQLWP